MCYGKAISPCGITLCGSHINILSAPTCVINHVSGEQHKHYSKRKKCLFFLHRNSTKMQCFHEFKTQCLGLPNSSHQNNIHTLRHCISQENHISYVSFTGYIFLRQPKMTHQASDRINTKLWVIMLEVHPWVSPHKDISCLPKLFPKRIYFHIVECRDLRDFSIFPISSSIR